MLAGNDDQLHRVTQAIDLVRENFSAPNKKGKEKESPYQSVTNTLTWGSYICVQLKQG